MMCQYGTFYLIEYRIFYFIVTQLIHINQKSLIIFIFIILLLYSQTLETLKNHKWSSIHQYKHHINIKRKIKNKIYINQYTI